MIKETEKMRAELSAVAMEIARVMSTEGYDEAELARLDARKRELRAKIKEAEAPTRSARIDAACIQRRSAS
jgi:uncharacterized protein involved in exopolysaccharide biosynthesis